MSDGEDRGMKNSGKQRRKGKRRPRPFPKGRQLAAGAVAEVQGLLGPGPYQRDHLIEYLHAIQDKFGHLSLTQLNALAHIMSLSEAEIFEVASFYHHFDILRDGETPPPPLTLRICNSLSCMLAGAAELADTVKEKIDSTLVRVVEVPCIGRCDQAPACHLGKHAIDRATPDSVVRDISNNQSASKVPDYQTLTAYRKDGGYKTLSSVRTGDITAEKVIGELSSAGLRGLGGAGFPAGKKWQIVRSYEGPRLMTVNADEGEPGTFKDRHYLEKTPHTMLEGALIAAHIIEAERIYIYLRDEYPDAREILIREIKALESEKLIERGFIELRRGAGAYICGEESAMIESIEGKRGLPRHRPPYIAENGLFGRPTLNHNVETLHWVPMIIENGAAWFEEQGIRGGKGVRSYSVSGRVKNPGLIIAPAGSTAGELIEQAGGMADGHALGGYLPGGASGGILPAAMADIPLDFGTLEEHGCFIGSHALIVFSTTDDVRAVAQNLLQFFAHESCGQCTPCRVGCEKARLLMEGSTWDGALLRELSEVMVDASICGLGQAAPNPILSVLRHWPEVVTPGAQTKGDPS